LTTLNSFPETSLLDIDDQIERDPVLRPDSARVVLRPFRPATEPRDLTPTDKARANRIVEHVAALGANEAESLLASVIDGFAARHRDLLAVFEARADEMEDAFVRHNPFTKTQRRLVGAYFLLEYSFESSALFNPSIVLAPSSEDFSGGGCRFILSLRAVGEGHVSSVTFRSGTIAEDGSVTLDPRSNLATIPAIRSRVSGPYGDDSVVAFDPAIDISERVIFPVTDAQSNGVEDARFVRFVDEGRIRYLATYTAYNGRAIRSEMMETVDFVTFRMTTLRGSAARNKGMALFPRRINGRYAMIARQDNENLHLCYSDDLHFWEEGRVILRPEFAWEFVQIGNCGAPIELDEGWLLLTHGVGPVRKYAIGAVLLDKTDPSIVLGRLREPLIRPGPSSRQGYVPNVVYTCGAIRHGAVIVVPYAVSDTFTRFATFAIDRLLARMS
jgi:predicted GH43/DUF377 family glycosyl hydrolase